MVSIQLAARFWMLSILVISFFKCGDQTGAMTPPGVGVQGCHSEFRRLLIWLAYRWLWILRLSRFNILVGLHMHTEALYHLAACIYTRIATVSSWMLQLFDLNLEIALDCALFSPTMHARTSKVCSIFRPQENTSIVFPLISMAVRATRHLVVSIFMCYFWHTHTPQV